MNWKKRAKAILFPPIPVMILLIPIAAVFLAYSTVFWGAESFLAISSYVLSAYTLTVCCFRLPHLILFFKTFKAENKYARLWRDEIGLRVRVSLYGTLIFNTAYALLQLGMGFRHRSFWFFSLAGYYFSLAAMRFFLASHIRRHKPGERMAEELKKYRACGIILLGMNLALALMIFFMVYWNRTFHHHEITTIALATFTFTSLTLAIINTVKYRKYNSPVYSASKTISLASACVSVLTLESTMLTTFDDGSVSLTGRRILLGLSGGVISAVIIAMAIDMIVRGTKRIKQPNTEEESSNGK